jgi:hypothetical protein
VSDDLIETAAAREALGANILRALHDKADVVREVVAEGERLDRLRGDECLRYGPQCRANNGHRVLLTLLGDFCRHGDNTREYYRFPDRVPPWIDLVADQDYGHLTVANIGLAIERFRTPQPLPRTCRICGTVVQAKRGCPVCEWTFVIADSEKRVERYHETEIIPILRDWNVNVESCGECGKTVEQFLPVCGCSPRHARLQLDALTGPPEYLKALGVVRRVLQDHESGPIVALVGKRGTGKTQLGASLVRHAVWNLKWSARIRSVVELLGELKAGYSGGGGDASWLNLYGSVKLLVIDEIAERLDTDHTRVMITALIDRRYANVLPTVLVGNVEPDQFAECVGASVADRVNEGGGIVYCDWLSFRTTA